MNILVALLLLSVIIFIHELGHFLAARWFKIPVQEFSIGMGPEIYSYYTGKTTYSLRAIPLGGYVNIEGMEVDSKVVDGFNSKTPIQRFIVLIAGIFMNFLLAFIVVVGMVFSSGKAIQNELSIIGGVLAESKAINILQKGDKIKAIDGVTINSWKDINEELSKKNTQDIVVEYERANKNYKNKIELIEDKESNKRYLGIVPSYTFERYGVGEGIKESWRLYIKMFANVFNGLRELITGKVSAKELSGPIGIVKVVGDVSKTGNSFLLLGLVAILSINVGLFNFLPFPALDGGRILFIILEILGIKVNNILEERVHKIGMLILFGVFIFTTFNDILRI